MIKDNKTFYKTRFIPKHPQKYIGDVNNIILRSSWELNLANNFDRNIMVLEWSYESIVIPYIKWTDKKVHKYYPDFYVKFKDKNGNIQQEIIEIKPKTEITYALTLLESNFTQMYPIRSKNIKTKIYHQTTALVNASKWKYAKEWCEKRNMKFKLKSENNLFK